MAQLGLLSYPEAGGVRIELAQHRRGRLFISVLELCRTLEGQAPYFICPLPRRPSWASGPRPLCTVQHCRLILFLSLSQLFPPIAGFDFFLFPQAFIIRTRSPPRLVKSCPWPLRVLLFLSLTPFTPRSHLSVALPPWPQLFLFAPLKSGAWVRSSAVGGLCA